MGHGSWVVGQFTDVSDGSQKCDLLSALKLSNRMFQDTAGL